MHCAGCERSVKFTLANLPGVRQVEANHKTQLIEVTLVSAESELEMVKAELDWIGYEVEVV
ncbi:MAG: heavy-metal-associated domain-containing protein [Chloroflexi bacterium]|nr:MAG: heavy-metal-associated domain-containing protein [Chloroflexota bacterium]